MAESPAEMSAERTLEGIWSKKYSGRKSKGRKSSKRKSGRKRRGRR